MTTPAPQTDKPDGKSGQPLLEVAQLRKYFPVYSSGLIRRQSGEIKAVDDISFTVRHGETLGIVGESGSGKTTAARAILRAITPTAGQVWFDSDCYGRVDLAALTPRALKPLRREMQMIFQDPFSSLNPRMTVGDIVGEPLVIHGMANRAQRRDQVAAMLEKVGLLPRHMQRYPHAFSGGQRQRIGIARALIMHPKLVVADEAVSALDVSVQAQVINLLQDLQDELQLTYLFVAHDLSVVRHICTRIAVMYLGKIVEFGRTEAIFSNPRHPYTRSLLSAIPSPDPDVVLQPVMVGEVGDKDRFAGQDMTPVWHED
jgi:peptide/nickel transport system ATP-binding protein